MRPYSRYCAGLFLTMLCACNQTGNVQQAIKSDEVNLQNAREDADVRGDRLEGLADDLNAQAHAAGGARGRALEAEARQDTSAARAVREAGEARVEAIERNISAEVNTVGHR